jgi:Fe-S-cluster containining protein
MQQPDHHQLGSTIAASQHRNAAEALSRQPRSLAIIQAASAAARDASHLAEVSPDRDRRECRAGCWHCCCNAVAITAPEALLIAAGLRAANPQSSALAAIRARIADVSGRVSTLTIEQRAAARVPCALLSDAGECTIYEFRPIGCRGWTSFSREACVRACDSGLPGHDAPVDRVALTVAGCVTEGLCAALCDASLDDAHYELHAAVLQALEARDAAERYAAGQPLFAHCARVTSERLAGRP